jgi:hypothetical protein
VVLSGLLMGFRALDEVVVGAGLHDVTVTESNIHG